MKEAAELAKPVLRRGQHGRSGLNLVVLLQRKMQVNFWKMREHGVPSARKSTALAEHLAGGSTQTKSSARA